MNCGIKIIPIAILWAFTATSAAHAEKKVALQEIRFSSGYIFGDLKPENTDPDYVAFPFTIQFGYNINSLLGIENHKGNLQLAVEPYVAAITTPEAGVEAGVAFFIKYAYPLHSKISPYIEVGAGPMYFGIDTFEQEKAGFNFVDQGGAGFQYFFDTDKSFNLGYRFRHISHAEFTDNENAGINSHAIIAGISLFY